MARMSKFVALHRIFNLLPDDAYLIYSSDATRSDRERTKTARTI